ncbi:MAG: PSD1 and planctomycete cytochrome C domain-containing protein [Planctomycetaceae bacterium]
MRISLAISLLCIVAPFSTPALIASDKTAESAKPASAPVFEDDIVPILKAYCWRCHGGEGRQANLDMRTFALLSKGSKSGAVVAPGSAETSPLFQKMAAGKMPPGDLLKPTSEHIALVKKWIDAGAATRDEAGPLAADEDPPLTEENRRWWAFQKPVRQPVPQVQHAERVGNPIDAFLLGRLEEKGLSFSPEADRATLIRRVYFDLTGLPPQPDEIDAFLADDSADAYARLIDRLLSSPHYGERWGRHWLDAAGYVDTMGSDNDAAIIDERPGIWKYRDYVIRAFNDDKPYDRFLLEQLAGDELVDWRNAKEFTPEIIELLTATGFLRQAADVTFAPELNTADIRHQVLYDTVQIFSANVLGLTVHCAQCHTHKFDPISHADYYRLMGVFAGGYDVQNWQTSKLRCVPDVAPARKSEIDAHNADVDKQVASLKEQMAVVRRPFEAKLAAAKLQSLPEAIRADVKTAVDTPAEKRSEVQKYLAEKLGSLLVVSPQEVDQSFDGTAKQQTAELNQRIGTLENSKQSHGVIQAFWDAGSPPPTYLYRRGDFQTPGAPLTPGVLKVLDDPSRPFVLPQPPSQAVTSGYRTALARWLVQPDHPLTARVIVNRVWQQYFGRGIVAIPDNFGASGVKPTHPELLDWLATEFVRGGWSFKHLHRLILTSSAYRQVSREDGKSGLAVDPENLLLWRMPLRRLESEAVRDRVLAVSGILEPTPGGPPVPLKSLPDGQTEIDVDKLPRAVDQYRRSVYLFARRNYQLTEMRVFDQPSVAHNCTRRGSSAVVLQSLTMLNGKFLFEQAERFAARVRQSASADGPGRIRQAFRIALGREVSPEELQLTQKLLDEQCARYAAESPSSPQAAADAALVDLCQMLLNTNEFLYVN